MRITWFVVAAVAIATPARADRSAAVSIGVTGDVRATGASFGDAGASHDLSLLGGLTLDVSFEHAPLAIPAEGAIASEARLVPELLAGFVADSTHAEGMVGGGLRGELQLASHRRGFAMRTALYAAARAFVIDKDQDGAAELVIGEYLTLAHGRRFGWEGGAMIRPRTIEAPAGSARELDTVMTIYLGWQ